jgi:hypothetical protein
VTAGSPRHQRIVIDLAVLVLRAAMVRSGQAAVNTIEVRLALRCLLHHCPDRWPLELFWDAAKATTTLVGRKDAQRPSTGSFASCGSAEDIRKLGRASVQFSPL